MLTQEQIAARRHSLGSSDAGPMLGISPWKSPRELWLEKTGQLEPADLGDNLAVMLGNGMERVILDAAMEKLRLDRPVYGCSLKKPDHPCIAATLDCLAMVNDCVAVPLEAKYAESPERWGPVEGGIHSLPDEYAAQVLHQCVVADSPRAFLAAYFSGRRRELRIYECLPTPEMLQNYERKAVEWWEKHVVGHVPPEQDEPCSLEVLARRHREPGKVVQLDAAMVQAWRDADAEAKAAAAVADAAKARVLEALGDAEAGECDLGTVSYRSQNRKEYTVPAGSFRVCRFSASKV